MAIIFSRQYLRELGDFISELPLKFKIFCAIFIVTTNIAGTTPFLGMIFYNYYIIEIWKISLLADIFFIFSMSYIFFVTIRFAYNAKSKFEYYLSPLITTLLIPFGFTISWFLVCMGGEFGYSIGVGLPYSDGNLGSFIMPISAEREMEHFSAVLFGYNGLWIPAIVTAIMIFTSVPKPEPIS